MAKKRRRRVAKERVRENAQKSSVGNWFNLPKGVEVWAPDKPGRYIIDILPYEVSSENHPDGIEAGTLWYKFPFRVHHGLGLEDESYVCPGSIGKPCPVCKEVASLKKNYDENKEAITSLQGQRYVAYNVEIDGKEEVKVFSMSRGKFADALEQELDEGDDDILAFFDVTDEGKTLRVRFSEDSYQGRKYLKATRIDFRSRKEMDEDKTLERVVDLDKILNILEYDDLEKVFMQVEDEDEGKEKKGRTSSSSKSSSRSSKYSKGKKKEEDDEDEDEFEDDEEFDKEEKETKKKHTSEKVTKKATKKSDFPYKVGDPVIAEYPDDGEKYRGKITSIPPNGEEVQVTFEDGDIAMVNKKKIWAPEDGEEVPEDDEEDEGEEDKKEKTSGVTFDDDDDDEWE